MSKRMLLCSLVLVFAALVSGDTYTKTFSPFDGVVGSFAVPGSVEVSPTNDYRISLDASVDVINALNIRVESGSLLLDFGASSRVTVGTAKYTLYVPAASLARFGQAGAVTLKVDGTCFDSSKSIVISASGSGSLVISKMVAGTISLRQSGSGTVIIDGTPGKITLDYSGVGTTYLIGAKDSVVCNASGSGKIYIDGKGSSVDISGNASGVITVYYTSGRCNLSGYIYGRTFCSKADSVSVPSLN
jgi:hypothetical protein